MAGSIIAKRYAKAFVKLTGLNIANIEKYEDTFKAIYALFKNKEAKQVLFSKAMPKTLKRQLLEYAMEQASTPKELSNFVLFIVEVDRLDILLDTFKAYKKTIESHNNVVRVTVESFAKVPDDTFKELMKALEGLLNKKVLLSIKENRELMGGFLVSYENNRIDLTLKNKLEKLTANVVL